MRYTSFHPLLLTIVCIWAQTLQIVLYAQTTRNEENFTSVRHEQSAYYHQFHFNSEQQFDSLYRIKNNISKPSTPVVKPKNGNCPLRKKVYGYHPYWFGSEVYNNYQFDLLSTFTYFSYELNPATGSYEDIHYWKTSPSIDMAKQAGCRVELCVTNFGSSDNSTFLSNSDVWDVLIDSLQSLLQYRGAHGVNIDFEGVPGSQRTNYKNFLAHLADRMHSEMPGSSVTVALYAVDWNNVFDLNFLNEHLDAFIVMGYDYHYAGDAQAGPVAPLYSGAVWNQYTLFKTINDYLAEGVNPDKLIMGIPYYGYDWPTNSVNVPAATTDSGTARTYRYLRDNFFDTYTRQWDAQSQSPYFIYISGGQTRQCWFEDEESLAARYNFALDKQLGGVGMWCLGNDDGYTQLWDMLADKFTICGEHTSGTLADTGGPLGNYRNNEDYTFSFVAPNEEGSVNLNFSAFNLEAGFDFLYIHDGPTIASPLIGTFSGNTLPPSITSTGNALTLRFVSDGATVSTGFVAEWTSGCHPQTEILPLQTSYNSNFIAFFDDDDNCGSGFEGKFYQVVQSEQANGQWKGNAQKGFLHEDFDSGSLGSQWIAESGTWIYDDGHLTQSNQGLDNSNFYTELSQSNNYTYLYQMQLLIGGTGSNRRAGFHFFADDANASQRGNSYFVYFRPDQQSVQIYETIDNNYQLKAGDTCLITPNTWVDVKVSYRPTNGHISVYLNNKLVCQWTDSTPLSTGNYLSLRTAGCEAQYDKINVFLSRSSNNVNVAMSSNPDDTGTADLLLGNGSFFRIYTLVHTTSQWSAMDYAQSQINTVTAIDGAVEGEIQQTISAVAFPNPATNQVFLRINTLDNNWGAAVNENYKISVLSADGRVIQVVEQQQISDHNAQQTIAFDCATWPAGLYLIRMENDNFQKTLKFLKLGFK